MPFLSHALRGVTQRPGSPPMAEAELVRLTPLTVCIFHNLLKVWYTPFADHECGPVASPSRTRAKNSEVCFSQSCFPKPTLPNSALQSEILVPLNQPSPTRPKGSTTLKGDNPLRPCPCTKSHEQIYIIICADRSKSPYVSLGYENSDLTWAPSISQPRPPPYHQADAPSGWITYASELAIFPLKSVSLWMNYLH